MSLRDIANPKKRRERFTRTLTGKQVRAMKKRGYDAERELVGMMREQGFDAVVQSNHFDPGVEAARLAVRIPVIGPFRTALAEGPGGRATRRGGAPGPGDGRGGRVASRL